MQHLTFIRHPRYAQAFVDYLKSLGLSASIQIRDDGANVFIEREEELPQALEELQRFLNEPNHERYRQASWLVAEDDAQAEKLSGMYRGITFARIMKLSGVITKTVIVICLGVYIITSQGMDAAARAPAADLPTLSATTGFSFAVSRATLTRSFPFLIPSK